MDVYCIVTVAMGQRDRAYKGSLNQIQDGCIDTVTMG